MHRARKLQVARRPSVVSLVDTGLSSRSVAAGHVTAVRRAKGMPAVGGSARAAAGWEEVVLYSPRQRLAARRRQRDDGDIDGRTDGRTNEQTNGRVTSFALSATGRREGRLRVALVASLRTTRSQPRCVVTCVREGQSVLGGARRGA